MATVKKDYIIKVMTEQSCAYWRVTDGGDKFIGENDTEADLETAIGMLNETLGFVEDQRVKVMCSNRTKKEKASGGRGYKQHEFIVRLSDAASGAMGMGGTGTLNMIFSLMGEKNDLQRKLDRQEDLKKQEELQRQFDEFKKKKQDPDVMDRGISLLENYFKSTTIKGAGLAGAEDGPVDVDVVTKQKMIKEAIKRLAAVDPHIEDTMTVLADFAEKNKDDYFSAIKKVKLMNSL